MNNELGTVEVKHIHRNRPQLEAMLVMPRTLVSLWGRGTGKTMGLTSYIAYNAVTQMPGSVGAIGCDSYKHLKREILPELFKVWKRDFGLVKDRDYWVNEFPPKELGIPEAIRPVLDKENMIFFRNGSCIKLFSFNFAALQNGDSIDWMIIEEAKLVKPERVNEALPCLRGNEDVFGDLACHKSLTLISDMPDHVKGMWLLDYEKKVDEERIEVIFQIQKHLFILQSELDGGVTEKRAAEIQFQLTFLKDKLNEIRRNTVFVSYASTLDNVHSVGIDTILNLKRILSPERYRLSVLNWHPRMMEACFYAMLSEGRHGYVAISELAEKAASGVGDCRWDTDIDFSQALDISMDYNAKFSCMVVGQVQYRKRGPVLRFLKDFHVKHPKRIRDLIRLFDKYYKHLPNRVVNFYYDHTAKPENAKDTETLRDVIIDELEVLGWTVYDHQFKSTTHQKRYEDWANLFEQSDEDMPFSFEYNMENCRDWANACHYCEVEIKKYVEEGIEKNKIRKVKDPETDGKTDPLDAPHLTEAGDGLFVAKLQELTTPRGIGMRVG